MRDIKFRAWSKKDKLMLPWSTIRQSAFNNSKDGFGLLYQILVTRREDFHLMQYTGLKDKEGKEIYEGDIVRKPNDLWIGNESVGKDKGTFINCCFIEFVEGSFRINKIGNESKNFYGVINFSRNTKSEKLEVIGNIHDNPELLEK